MAVTKDRYIWIVTELSTVTELREEGWPTSCDGDAPCLGVRAGRGAPFVLSWRMVFYFECSDPRYTIYMGRDKFENEHLIANGWPEDLWCVHSPRLHLAFHARQQFVV